MRNPVDRAKCGIPRPSSGSREWDVKRRRMKEAALTENTQCARLPALYFI